MSCVQFLVDEIVDNVIGNHTNVDKNGDRNPEFEVDFGSGSHQSIDASTGISKASDNKDPPFAVIKSLFVAVGASSLFVFSFFRVIDVGKS